MRISTITDWAYGVTVILTALSGAAFLSAASAARTERAAVEQHLAFDVAAENLAVGVEILTDEARLYAMRGENRHRDAYQEEAGQVRSFDAALRRIRALDAEPAERAAIAEAERNLVELQAIDSSAVDAVTHGDAETARAMLFGPGHERAETAVVGALEHFRALTSERTRQQMERARQDNDRAGLVAKAMLSLTALLFLGVIYFVLKRRVSAPLTRMAGIVTRLARQDYAVEVPVDRRRDEIGDMTQAIQVFRENGLERDRLEAERAIDQHAKDCILQMTHRLQACETLGELAEVVSCFAPQTFPELAGRLYILEPNRNALTLASSWLDPAHSTESFAPTLCWGVRRGRPHLSNGDHGDVTCPHIGETTIATSCIPLTAQGDTIGLLYFEERPEAMVAYTTPRIFLDLMSDNVALALANLRLRERLARLAEEDPLTGLLNRRRLDEALDSLEPGAPVACLMLDIDHFKKFNDLFGHEAGDAVMQHVAATLKSIVGEDGVAYRFGGEEFTVVLPDASEDQAYALAEHIRTNIASVQLAHQGELLGHITVSIGLAVTPADAPVATLLPSADAALLRAKAAGRNQTVTARRSLDNGERRSAG